jgi:phosphatidate cytidylyltransferase
LSYNRNKLQLWYDILAISGFDVGGYIVGKYIGNTKFNIYSPQKTVEGVLGGAVFCGSFCYFVGGYSLAKVFFLMFFALFGDLFESYIKRSNNKKDSGSIIYGHGGILDRIDSHLFTLCFLHFWF